MNFTVNDFSNTISLNDTHSIYINVLNKTSFQNYEMTIIKKDIPNVISIQSFYKLMIKCFETNNNENNTYTVNYETSDGKLGLTFNANIDDLIDIKHTIYIKESHYLIYYLNY